MDYRPWTIDENMNYPETIQYLYTQLPMFTRDGASAYKEDLFNIVELCKRLDNPQNKFRSVHVAGTNGKGSTSHMLAAILQTAGYKTGLYTSPHLKDFRERIRINGQMISEQTVIDFVADHITDFDDIAPSFFEMTVGLAFDIFAKEQVDIAVVEVGLGGRLDSTNIITPLLSVVTNIGWDHMNILGNTLQLIAGEKAGIIKRGIPAIIGEYQPEIAQVFIDKGAKENSHIVFASEEWVLSPEVRKSESPKVSDGLLNITLQKNSPKPSNTDFLSPGLPDFRTSGQTNSSSSGLSDFPTSGQKNFPTSGQINLQLDLTGTYQLKNVKTVLSAVENLRSQGFNITDDHIRTALKQVKTLTGLHGRWEILSQHPLTICDTGHNPDGIQEVLKNITSVSYSNLHMVIGMVNDKDISKVLAMLPQKATYYFCKPDIPRGLEAESIKQQAENYNLQGEAYLSVKDALKSAQNNAGGHDLVFVGGSTFVVAEVV